MRSSTGSGNFAGRCEEPVHRGLGDDRGENCGGHSLGFAVCEGSQPWKGKSGAFTRKATAKPRKISVLSLVPDSDEAEGPLRHAERDDGGEHQSDPAIV